MRRRTVGASVGAAATLVLALALPATEAATNNPGAFEAGGAYCDTDDIIVTFPDIRPAAVQRNHPPFAHGAEGQIPAQDVAFRANLAYWNGTQWVAYLQGTWFWKRAKQAESFLGEYEPWRDLNGNWAPSPIGFWNLPNSGDYDNPYYYAVWYEFYWWGDDYRDSGYTWSWAFSHQENRAQPVGTPVIGQGSTGWCKYPGPNWLLDLN